MTAKLRIFIAVIAVALPLDQLTKLWINQNLRINFDRIEVIEGFFYITHVRNPGNQGVLARART
jgi:lipoprotein signal peptidase